MSAYANDPRVAVVPCGFNDVEYRVRTPNDPDGSAYDRVYSKDYGDTWHNSSPTTFTTADAAIRDLIGPPQPRTTGPVRR